VRDAVVTLACASRALASAIVADPSLLDPVRDAHLLPREQTLEGYRSSWDAHDVIDDGVLRRWKRRELLRTAVRDLLGLADMPAVGRELSALAQVCLEGTLAIVQPDVPFAIVGMGKLGGRELNYASDVDVLFVHDGDPDRAERAARAVLATMSGPTEDGIVFRTDANLRPEGRQPRYGWSRTDLRHLEHARERRRPPVLRKHAQRSA